MTRVVVVSRNPAMAMGLSGDYDVVEVRPQRFADWMGTPSEPYDALVLDMGTPVDGRQTVLDVRAYHPATPVLLVGGAANGNGIDVPGTAVLGLPVTRPRLLAAVERLLAEPMDLAPQPLAEPEPAQSETVTEPELAAEPVDEAAPTAAPDAEPVAEAEAAPTAAPDAEPVAEAEAEPTAPPEAAAPEAGPGYEYEPLLVDASGAVDEMPEPELFAEAEPEQLAEPAQMPEPEPEQLAEPAQMPEPEPEPFAEPRYAPEPPQPDAEPEPAAAAPLAPAAFRDVTRAVSWDQEVLAPARTLHSPEPPEPPEQQAAAPGAATPPPATPAWAPAHQPVAGSFAVSDSRHLVDHVRALLVNADQLYGLEDTADVVVSDAVERIGADGAVLLLPDGDVWRVASGHGLRPLEYRFELDGESWLVDHVAHANQGVIVENSDGARKQLSRAPLASRHHLLAAPLPGVNGILLLARDQDPPFDEASLVAVYALAIEAQPLLAAALDLRSLARALGEFRDEGTETGLGPATR